MIYKCDIGVQLIYNVIEDLTGTYTAVGFDVVKPDKTEDEWTGFVQNKTRICYSIASGDLDQTGKYQIQPWVTGANSSIVRGEIKSFIVSETLKTEVDPPVTP
jgi:hypothetical protein